MGLQNLWKETTCPFSHNLAVSWTGTPQGGLDTVIRHLNLPCPCLKRVIFLLQCFPQMSSHCPTLNPGGSSPPPPQLSSDRKLTWSWQIFHSEGSLIVSGRLEQRCTPPMIDFSSSLESQSRSSASALQLPNSTDTGGKKQVFRNVQNLRFTETEIHSADINCWLTYWLISDWEI